MMEKVADKLFEEGYATKAALHAAEDGDILALGLPTAAVLLHLNVIKSAKEEVESAKEEVEITLKYERATSNVERRESLVGRARGSRIYRYQAKVYPSWISP